MATDNRSWTCDDSATSNNPGGVQVNYLRWLVHYPLWPLIWILPFLPLLALALYVHWGFWFGVALFGGMNAFYWLRITDHYRRGDTVPAIVISLDPPLMAAGPNMTMGQGSYPAIKIVELPLSSSLGQELRVGAMLPTVALYARDPDGKVPHFIEIDPRPVEAGTGNLSVVQWKLTSIPRYEWDDLYASLQQVPQPYECGLYFARQF